MGYTKEQRIINSMSGNTKKQRNEKKTINPTGSFDIPNKSGDHMRSIKRDEPVNDFDLVNKKYVDDEIDADILTHKGDASAHHAQSHDIASHSDTTATGAELNTLTDGSNSDALHDHTMTGITDISAGMKTLLDNTVAQGDLVYGSAANVMSQLAKGTANYKLFMDAGATLPEWSNGFYVGTFTYDTATATGTVAYTGVGFKPSVIIMFGGVSGSFENFKGFCKNTLAYGYSYLSGTGWYYSGSRFGYLYQSASIYTSVALQSMDADGFTLSYTKTGAKTGTLRGIYLAIR